MTDAEKEQLKQNLILDINRLANLLLPGGKFKGNKWRCDNLYGGEGQSFNMEISGERAGLWCDLATGEGGDIFDLIMQNQGLTFSEALDWAQDFCGTKVSIEDNKYSESYTPKVKHTGYPEKPEICYEYLDESGETVLCVERIEEGGKKRFVQWSKLNGLWYKTSAYCPKPYPLWSIYGVEPDEVVVIHEGEKCAEFAAEEGLTGYHTCTLGGASNARTSDYRPLAGHSVVICPDNDEPGKKYAADLKELLIEAGVKDIKLLELEQLPHKGDVVDWFEMDKTPTDWERALADAPVIYDSNVKVEVVEEPKPEKDFRYVPESMLSMPGFVNDVVDYTLSVSPYPNRVHAFGAAVCLQALLASNRIVGDMATRPNIYINCLGSSASGKNKPRVVNRQVINAIGAHTHIYDNIASMEGLEDLLEQHSNVLFQPDEFDSFLAASASGDSRFRRISTYLMTLYTSADADITRRPKAHEKGAASQLGRIIQKPHLTMLATSTPTRYFESLDSQSMADGFIGRMWTLCAKPVLREKSDPNKDYNKPLPQNVVEVAQHWWELHKPEAIQNGDKVCHHFPEPLRVPLTASAHKRRGEIEDYFIERYNKDLEDDVRCAVYGRGLEHVNKWSLLMACSEDPYDLRVQDHHIDAAFEFVRYQIKTVLNANETYVYKNENDKKVKRVKQALQSLGGHCNKGELLQKTRYSKRDLDDVLNTMIEAGDVEVEVIQTEGRGRKPVIVRMVG